MEPNDLDLDPFKITIKFSIWHLAFNNQTYKFIFLLFKYHLVKDVLSVP